MTFWTNKPVAGDDLATALTSYVNDNFSHLWTIWGLEHSKDASDDSIGAHSESLYKTYTGTLSRDMSTATGDVATTGVGFKPQAINFFGVWLDSGSNIILSFGGHDGTNDVSVSVTGIPTVSSSATSCILLAETGVKSQFAKVKTLDADGFTLTWQKAGSPTGTAYIYYVCKRFSA